MPCSTTSTALKSDCTAIEWLYPSMCLELAPPSPWLGLAQHLRSWPQSRRLCLRAASTRSRTKMHAGSQGCRASSSSAWPHSWDPLHPPPRWHPKSKLLPFVSTRMIRSCSVKTVQTVAGLSLSWSRLGRPQAQGHHQPRNIHDCLHRRTRE